MNKDLIGVIDELARVRMLVHSAHMAAASPEVTKDARDAIQTVLDIAEDGMYAIRDSLEKIGGLQGEAGS